MRAPEAPCHLLIAKKKFDAKVHRRLGNWSLTGSFAAKGDGSGAGQNPAGQVPIVFKEGHRQAVNLARIVRSKTPAAPDASLHRFHETWAYVNGEARVTLGRPDHGRHPADRRSDILLSGRQILDLSSSTILAKTTKRPRGFFEWASSGFRISRRPGLNRNSEPIEYVPGHRSVFRVRRRRRLESGLSRLRSWQLAFQIGRLIRPGESLVPQLRREIQSLRTLEEELSKRGKDQHKI